MESREHSNFESGATWSSPDFAFHLSSKSCCFPTPLSQDQQGALKLHITGPNLSLTGSEFLGVGSKDLCQLLNSSSTWGHLGGTVDKASGSWS